MGKRVAPPKIKKSGKTVAKASSKTLAAGGQSTAASSGQKSYVCPGCKVDFVTKYKLDRHLKGYTKYLSDPVTLLQKSKKCQNALLRQSLGTYREREASDRNQARQGTEARRVLRRQSAQPCSVEELQKVVVAPAEAQATVLAKLPSVWLAERDGIGKDGIRDAIAWLRTSEAVRIYLDSLRSPANAGAAGRFLILVAHSVMAVDQGVVPSENTLAIGVGDDVSKIEDVCCTRFLVESSRQAGLSWEEVLLWVLVGHCIVRPHVAHRRNALVTSSSGITRREGL